MKKSHKDNILKLRSEGKTYNEIRDILGCSKATICYHCGRGQKKKFSDRQKRNRSKPTSQNEKRAENFQAIIKKGIKSKSERFSREDVFVSPSFRFKDIIEKFGEFPRCYLTGRQLDWSISTDISFDHIIPRSKGGDNSIDNLGLCCRDANMSKTYLTTEEYLSLCKEVLENFGYIVTKN